MKDIMNIKWLHPLLCAAGLIVLGACTDDHFDINADVQGEVSLWENIKNNPQLSQFADILQRTTYSKSEGNLTSQNYADLFSNDQTFTIWAPADNTFDYDRFDALLKSGDVLDNYTVEKELIRNIMTRYSHVMNGTGQLELRLFNDKNALFNCAEGTINNYSITTPNIGASNGILHITDGAVAYQPNLYEYLAINEDIDSLHQFIKGYEKNEFSESQSTQGPTVNGNITWVDSVMYTHNQYLSNINAYINREDSCYVMIMPTNQLWKEVLEKTRSLYRFKSSYSQSVTTMDENGNSTTQNITTELSDVEMDSLQNLYSKSAIVDNLVFNVNSQYGHPFEDFAQEGKCDSLQSTIGTVFYDPYSARLFDGQQPVTLSNGYAYVVDHFNFRPEDTWGKMRKIETEYNRFIETYQNCTPTTERINKEMTYVDLNGETQDTLVEVSVLRTIQTSSAANPVVTFKIYNTNSCRYDIYLVMAYNTEAMMPNNFRAYISYHDAENAEMVTTQLQSENEDPRSFQNKAPYVDVEGNYHYTDSVLLAKDFEFPVCTQGLENAYATIRIQSYVNSSQTSTYSREMWIDKIVLKMKEE